MRSQTPMHTSSGVIATDVQPVFPTSSLRPANAGVGAGQRDVSEGHVRRKQAAYKFAFKGREPRPGKGTVLTQSIQGATKEN